MKQLIVVLLLLGGGYYLYNNGFLNVIKGQIGVNSQFFMGGNNSASKTVAKLGLPEKEPSRAGGLKGATENIKTVERTIFDTYDASACYAYVEMAYANGSDDSALLINRYLNAFTLPEEKAKIFNMLLMYKDKQTLDILKNFFDRGVFSRKVLLRKIADFKSFEVAPIITEAMKDPNASVAAEAKLINDEISQQPWYNQPTADGTPTLKRTLPTQQIEDAISAPMGS